MLVDFAKLPGSSRAWIFQSNREFSSQEVSTITNALHTFCNEWQAHGQPLASNFQILENRFVILLVDEESHAASGCSIDGSVRVMKNLQQQLGIDFFDRTQIAFSINGKIEIFPLSQLKNSFATGGFTARTLTVNTLAATKSDVEKNWLLPAEKSWLAKYLPKTAAI